MDVLGRRLALRFGIKRANAFGTLFGAAVASVVAASVVLAAIAVSNMLTFGPVQVIPGPAVTLTEVKGLPSSIAAGEQNDVEFRIEAARAVSNATLRLRVRAAGITLSDPTIAQVEYKHPHGGSNAIVLAALDGNLGGELKSGWEIPAGYDQTAKIEIPAGYDQTAKIEIAFLPDAPAAAYQLDVWIEGTVGAGSNAGSSSAASSSSQHDVQATDAETFSPENLTISVGDGVQWTSEDKAHTVTFSDPSLPSRDYLPSGDSFYVVFDQAGTFAYVCEFHDGMIGTIIVEQ